MKLRIAADEEAPAPSGASPHLDERYYETNQRTSTSVSTVVSDGNGGKSEGVIDRVVTSVEDATGNSKLADGVGGALEGVGLGSLK